jgi:hypothetical protein
MDKCLTKIPVVLERESHRLGAIVADYVDNKCWREFQLTTQVAQAAGGTDQLPVVECIVTFSIKLRQYGEHSPDLSFKIGNNTERYAKLRQHGS